MNRWAPFHILSLYMYFFIIQPKSGGLGHHAWPTIYCVMGCQSSLIQTFLHDAKLTDIFSLDLTLLLSPPPPPKLSYCSANPISRCAHKMWIVIDVSNQYSLWVFFQNFNILFMCSWCFNSSIQPFFCRSHTISYYIIYRLSMIYFEMPLNNNIYLLCFTSICISRTIDI